MGTSSSQRSPSTPEWERVRQLYRQPNPDPREVASRIVSALDAGSRQDLSGPGVACCLSTVLRGSAAVAEDGLAAVVPGGLAEGWPPLLQVTQRLQEQAERRVADLGLASRFTELGLRALGTTLFEAASGGSDTFQVSADLVATNLGAYAAEHRLHDLSLCFLAHDFSHLFSHFVTRDISDFTGTDALPTELQRSQLRDAVARCGHESALRVEAAVHEEALSRALRLDPDEADAQVQLVLADLTHRGLEVVAAGGAA